MSRKPLESAWWEGCLCFLLELAREEAEIERPGYATEHRASLLRERDRGLAYRPAAVPSAMSFAGERGLTS